MQRIVGIFVNPWLKFLFSSSVFAKWPWVVHSGIVHATEFTCFSINTPSYFSTCDTNISWRLNKRVKKLHYEERGSSHFQRITHTFLTICVNLYAKGASKEFYEHTWKYLFPVLNCLCERRRLHKTLFRYFFANNSSYLGRKTKQVRLSVFNYIFLLCIRVTTCNMMWCHMEWKLTLLNCLLSACLKSVTC